MKDLYSGSVRIAGGRNGRAVSDDDIFDIALAFPKALGGSGAAPNPEQLFASGFAACFNTSLRHAARSLGLDAGDVAIHATATLTLAEDGTYGVKLGMELELPGLLSENDAAVVAEARRICAYSNATRGNVDVAVTVRR